MPGPQIKNWRQYHGLRRRGYSKSRAAQITNAGKRAARKGGRRSRR